MITLSLSSIFVNLLILIIQAFFQIKEIFIRFRNYLARRKLQKYAE